MRSYLTVCDVCVCKQLTGVSEVTCVTRESRTHGEKVCVRALCVHSHAPALRFGPCACSHSRTWTRVCVRGCVLLVCKQPTGVSEDTGVTDTRCTHEPSEHTGPEGRPLGR